MSGSPSTCDTSVLIPALMPAHDSFMACREALSGVSALPVHVMLETYRVLTSLPGTSRVPPGTAALTIEQLGWELLQLPAEEYVPLVTRLGAAGIGGGPSYDALVAQTAQLHGYRLLTRDIRAKRTYDAVGVEYGLVGSPE